ncbi:TPA: hypothetical protein QHW48_003044 [Escherichia coli]|nr:hypothetical protein [Escherichia coli]
MPSDDDFNSRFKQEVARRLKDSLNLHRQLAEEVEPEDDETPVQSPDEASPQPKVSHAPKKTAVRIRGIARKRAAEARKMAVAASSKRIPTATPSQQVTRTESKILTEFTSVKQVNSLDTEHERKQLNNKDFEAEIALKKRYVKWFLIILAFQLLIMNGVFIADGAGKLEFEDLTLQLYMGGTLTEVFGLVLVVTKYLFKRK